MSMWISGRSAIAAVVLVAGATFCPHPVLAQTGERDVYVTVLDGDGVPITGMTADYFAVREDGKDRTVLRVLPLTTPMHVAVLVDTGLGTNVATEEFKAAITGLVEQLAREHQVTLYSFGERASQVVPFTKDIVRIREGISGMFARSAGASFLLDAADLAARALQAVAPERPVIIVVTTENPEMSNRSAGKVLKVLAERAIVLHAVVLGSATGSGMRGAASARLSTDVASRKQNLDAVIALGEGDRERVRFLQEGTKTTGGDIQRVTSVSALAPALARLTAQCATSYRLTFARPASQRTSKDLQVGVLLDGVTVRASVVPSAAPVPAPRK